MNGICDFALQLPGPERRTGYNNHTTDLTHAKTGVTIHTAEYDVADWDEKVLYNALFSGREASWHFTITKEGWLFQHYPVGAVTWHCGHTGNLWTVGVECEGYAPNKISGPQYELLVKLLKWIGETENWIPYRRGTPEHSNVCGGLYEHKDWMDTLCQVFSRGMIDPDQLIADLKEEPMVDWPKEKLRLLNDFLLWWDDFPESQEQKELIMRQDREDEAYREFFERQIAWRSPPR